MADENIKDDGLNVVETTEDKTAAELDPKEVKKAESEKQRKKILIISAIVAAVILIGVIVFGCYKISSDIKAKRGEIVFFNGNNMYTDGTFSDPLHSDKVDIYSARSGYVNTDGKEIEDIKSEIDKSIRELSASLRTKKGAVYSAIRIPAKCKKLIKEELRMLGITQGFVYPDIQHISDSLINDD